MRVALLLWLLATATASAHIGSPDIIFEGKAGHYPVRVVVRPPGVVPGLAEINVRILEGQAERVTALPVYFRAGRKGAPPPDVAERVRGDTNLFTATLWFMESGAYSVDVGVEGAQGKGTVAVPVNSVAMTRNAMKPWFRNMLLALASALFVGAVWLSGAAFTDSILEPGTPLTRRSRWRKRFTMAGGAVILVLLLWHGNWWWNYEDREYRNNRLYQPTPMSAEVDERKGQPVLRLTLKPNSPRRSALLIPDHGKLMHLFMVREPDADAFAHLHPLQQQSSKTFEAAVPPLPEGKYQLYADITHENGFAETLIASIDLPALSPTYVALWKMSGRSDVICSSGGALANATNFSVAPDMDDSWHVAREQSSTQRRSGLTDGLSMLWESNLTFRLVSPEGSPLPIEPYMGMFGHAIVRHKTGSVFAHVHPVGNFSMASQQLFNGANATNHIHITNTVPLVSFPYEFPRPGPYRLWVQLKSQGRVYTGVFDTENPMQIHARR